MLEALFRIFEFVFHPVCTMTRNDEISVLCSIRLDSMRFRDLARGSSSSPRYVRVGMLIRFHKYSISEEA